jgi:lipoprotein signal peptidase
VFNVADASITTGAAFLLLFTWFMDGKDPEEEILEELDVVEA